MNTKRLFIGMGILLVLFLEGILIWVVLDISLDSEVDSIFKTLIWFFPLIFPVICFLFLYIKVKEGEIKGGW